MNHKALKSAISKLMVSDHYYCDSGNVAGQEHVVLRGHLTQEEFQALTDALDNKDWTK